jgi:hypothetical protein
MGRARRASLSFAAERVADGVWTALDAERTLDVTIVSKKAKAVFAVYGSTCLSSCNELCMSPLVDLQLGRDAKVTFRDWTLAPLTLRTTRRL